MAKLGKGKLRTALANHNARTAARKQQKAREEARERSAKRSVSASSSRSSTQRAPPKRHARPFLPDDTILLVGEGNFSFTLSLLSEPHNHSPSQILATSYDTEDEVYSKYPDAREIVAKIRALAGPDAPSVLAFGVDAGALHKCSLVSGGKGAYERRWSKVWFGFPHVGAGHKDEQRNVLANQLLILRFLVSVAPYLTQGPLPVYAAPKRARTDSDSEDEVEEAEWTAPTFTSDSVWRPLAPPTRQGSVLITLRNAVPYTMWNVPMLGKKLRLVLPSIAASAPTLPRGVHVPTLADVERNGAQYTLWRSFEFFPEDFPAYSHRRTIGFVEGLSSSHNEDLHRRPNQEERLRTLQVRGKHVGTGECRTWELALR